MKKKTMAFGGLLMAVAMTAYSVSGTYAKYVSTIDLTDEARVAKWDFYASSNEERKLNLFSDSYTLVKNEENKGIYVKSIDGDLVLAPGTKGEYQANFGGTMEVRHKFNIKFNAKDAEPVIYYSVDANNKVIEESLSTTKFDDALEYRPITYGVQFWEGGGIHFATNEAPKGHLVYVEGGLTYKQLEDTFDNLYNDPRNDFSPARLQISLKLSWQWKTNNDVFVNGERLDNDEVNKLDTFIGENLAPWISSTKGEENVGGTNQYKLSVTVEQVAEDFSTKTPVQP